MRSFVLVLMMVVSSPVAAAHVCDIPPDITNYVYVVESDTLLVGFGTDRYVYSPFDTLYSYLVVQNLGSEQFYANWGCDPQTRIRVLGGVCDSLAQPGCSIVYPGFPQFYFFVSKGTRLQSGECRVWRESWKMSCCSGPLSAGCYTVFGGMFNGCSTSLPYGFLVPVGGAQVTIEISSSSPVMRTSWGRIKALYRR
jgi:hypothetical protein